MTGARGATRDALPEHLNILLPVTRSQYCFHLLQLIRRRLRAIPARYHLVYFKDGRSFEREADIYRDCHELAVTFLAGHPFRVSVTEGGRGRLAAFARGAGSDLIMLAVPPEAPPGFPFTSRWPTSLLHTLTTPVFLLPYRCSSPAPDTPLERVLVQLEPFPATRLANAFALRAARRLCSSLILAAHAPRRQHDALREQLETLAFRYLPHDMLPRCTLRLTAGHFTSSFYRSIRETHPDLIIACNQYRSDMQRRHINRIVSDVLFRERIPLLVVRRYDHVAILRKKFHKIHTRLSPFELAKTDECPSRNDATADIPEERLFHQPMLLMGHYGRAGIRTALERYGVLMDFEKIGYPGIRIHFDTTDLNRHRIRISSPSLPEDEPLVDIVFLRRMIDGFPDAVSHFPKANMTYLDIEWMCLQDPKRRYKRGETPLPGQKHPGLGFGWKALMLLYFMAKRINADGICNIPQYYHSARFFHRFFTFVSPRAEGELMAIDRDTFPLHPVTVSRAVLDGRIMCRGEVFRWKGGVQILPLHPALMAYFKSKRYRSGVLDVLKGMRYRLAGSPGAVSSLGRVSDSGDGIS